MPTFHCVDAPMNEETEALLEKPVSLVVETEVLVFGMKLYACEAKRGDVLDLGDFVFYKRMKRSQRNDSACRACRRVGGPELVCPP